MTPEWIEVGRGLAYGGAACSFGLAQHRLGMGDCDRITLGCGCDEEKPELFGRMLVMIALPGTPGVLTGSSQRFC